MKYLNAKTESCTDDFEVFDYNVWVFSVYKIFECKNWKVYHDFEVCDYSFWRQPIDVIMGSINLIMITRQHYCIRVMAVCLFVYFTICKIK